MGQGGGQSRAVVSLVETHGGQGLLVEELGERGIWWAAASPELAERGLQLSVERLLLLLVTVTWVVGPVQRWVIAV